MGEGLEGPESHGGMGIMAAGMHQVVFEGAVGDGFFVVEAEGINIGAKGDEAGGMGAGVINDEAAPVGPHAELDAGDILKLVSEVGGGLEFLPAGLGMGMEVAAEGANGFSGALHRFI